MRRLSLIMVLQLLFLNLIIPQAPGEESSDKIIGGIYLGGPSVLNLTAGYETSQFGFKISGLYIGKNETNSAFGNGIQLDLYKPIGKFHSIAQKISFISGYTDIKNNTSIRLVYVEAGYTLQWKTIYVQTGIGKQILTSNYDELQDVFPFLNIGFLFSLENL